MLEELSKTSAIVADWSEVLSGHSLSQSLFDLRSELVLLHDDGVSKSIEKLELHIVYVFDAVNLPRTGHDLLMVASSRSELRNVLYEEVENDVYSLQLIDSCRLFFGYQGGVREVTNSEMVVVLSLGVVMHVDMALWIELSTNQSDLSLLSWIEARVCRIAVRNVWLD